MQQIRERASGRQQLGEADQIVGGCGEGETPSDTLEPTVAGLAQTARDFDPAEGLLDALTDTLAQGIAGVKLNPVSNDRIRMISAALRLFGRNFLLGIAGMRRFA